MNPKQLTVSVVIMGKEYRIMCPAPQEKNLIEAAQYLDKKMSSIKENSKITSDDRLAVITALNIIHEKLSFDETHKRLQDETNAQTKKVEDLTMKLTNVLEEHT